MSDNTWKPLGLVRMAGTLVRGHCYECTDKKFRAQKSTSNIFKLATGKPEIKNQGGQSQIIIKREKQSSGIFNNQMV